MNSKDVENVTIEKLYTDLESKLCLIAGKVIWRCLGALGHVEESDLVNEAFARGYIERWIKSFDISACPDHIAKQKPQPKVNLAAIPDDWTAEQVAQHVSASEAITDSNSDWEEEESQFFERALKYWICWKFRYFCGDELRRKVQRPTLNLDYNRGKEGNLLKVTAIQLDETFDVAVQHRTETQASENLEYCSEMEADVLYRFYWLDQTRAFIAQHYNCHPNTISATNHPKIKELQRAAFLSTRALLVQKVIELFNAQTQAMLSGNLVEANAARVEYISIVSQLAKENGWRWIESKFGHGWVRRVDGVDQFSKGILGTFTYIAAEHGIEFTLVQSKKP